MSKAIEYLDQPPAGWSALDILRLNSRKWDWCVLKVDVPLDQLKYCATGVALLYVRPDEYRPDRRRRSARMAYVTVPGKHRNDKAAWQTFVAAQKATNADA